VEALHLVKENDWCAEERSVQVFHWDDWNVIFAGGVEC